MTLAVTVSYDQLKRVVVIVAVLAAIGAAAWVATVGAPFADDTDEDRANQMPSYLIEIWGRGELQPLIGMVDAAEQAFVDGDVRRGLWALRETGFFTGESAAYPSVPFGDVPPLAHEYHRLVARAATLLARECRRQKAADAAASADAMAACAVAAAARLEPEIDVYRASADERLERDLDISVASILAAQRRGDLPATYRVPRSRDALRTSLRENIETSRAASEANREHLRTSARDRYLGTHSPALDGGLERCWDTVLRDYPEKWGSIDKALIERFLDEGVPVDRTDARGRTLLHHASRVGDMAVVTLLRRCKADDGKRDADGMTPADYLRFGRRVGVAAVGGS